MYGISLCCLVKASACPLYMPYTRMKIAIGSESDASINRSLLSTAPHNYAAGRSPPSPSLERLTEGDMLPHGSCSMSLPPILTFPHTGGRDLYLPLSATRGG
jgi:hypothetical protein